MGINVDNVIDKTGIVHLICSICTEVVEDPIILQTCEHMFCRVCITKWMTSETPPIGATNCPECRTIFSDSDIGKPSRILLNLIAEVKFRCGNPGCQVIIKYGDYIIHGLQCEMAAVKCDGCLTYLDQSLIEGHKAKFYTCKYRKTFY